MFQVGTACYHTPAAALQAAASAQTGAVVQHGGAAYIVAAQGTQDGISYTFTPIGGGASFLQQVPMQPEPCGLLTASDAFTLSWGIVAAWVAAFAVIFLARILRGETESNYGNA